jgi:ribosomal protein L34
MIVRHVASRNAASTAAGLTRYFPLQHGDLSVGQATESQNAITWRTAATISNFYARVTVNDRGASTFRVRVNTANGNSVLSVGASGTGEFEDTSNSDSISAGDSVDHSLVTGAGGTTFTHTVVAFSLSSDVWIGGTPSGGGTQVAGANTINYYGVSGDGGNDTTEARSQAKFAHAGTLTNLFINVNTNGRSTTTNFRSRKNTANGNLLIAIGSGVTGVLEDTSNTDSIASTDLVNLSITNGTGSGTIAIHTLKVEYASSAGYTAVAHRGGGSVLGTGSTVYMAAPAATFQTNGTEGHWQTLVKHAYTTRRLQAFISANATTGGTAAVKLRINGGDGTQLLSPGAGTTGFFEDTTNTDNVAATDELDIVIATGTGGNTTYRLVALGVEPPAAGRTTKNTRAWPLGVEIGMGWRMPA